MFEPATVMLVEPESLVSNWEASLRPGRVLFGGGRLAELGDLVSSLGGRRVLVVTDRGIARAGHLETALSSLASSDLESVVFDGVEESPTGRNVADAVEAARAGDVDFIVGLGGGSSMDCAKGVNFIYTNGGSMEDYWGFNRATKPMLPSVGVPSTAGTGSEAQSFALIAHEETHVKMACGDEKVRFRASILDPTLATTAPSEVTAVAGYDAVSHAVESYVTAARNPISQLFAKEAWYLLERSFPRLLAGDADAAAWSGMMLGAHLGGAAIETSMLGAAHALANPLTATFGTKHGVAIALVLPSVVRANGAAVGDLYADVCAAAGIESENGAAGALASRLEALRDEARLPGSLGDAGIEGADLRDLARQAGEQWTLQHNPRSLSESEILELYEGLDERAG